MTTFIHPVKCLNCSLHFNVYSWKEDWTPLPEGGCPECGASFAESGYLMWQASPSALEIFQHVPASATAVRHETV